MTNCETRVDSRLVTVNEAADFLRTSPKTLEGWRTRGGGPKFVRLGTRAVRYRPADLNEFIERGLRTSTASEPSGQSLDAPSRQPTKRARPPVPKN
jgi:predicted DNA-binding transcriptional regulator AlpA